MIIVCNSCSAQYSVSDAKVRGKLVRITCKHCSTAIVVDGRQMLEGEVPSQKPLSSYALPRRDESIVAAMPQSLRDPVPHPPPSSPLHAPAPAAMQTAMSAALREEDRTMVVRSRFGDDMSVHDERTVIGQIPKEALEFERMFAQRTQPPPPDEPAKPSASPPVASVPNPAPLPSFGSEPPESNGPEPEAEAEAEAEQEDRKPETEHVAPQGFSRSEPPTVGTKPNSDTRGLVVMAEATQPSVARSVNARRLRVTLITLLVLAVLVLLFVIKPPR